MRAHALFGVAVCALVTTGGLRAETPTENVTVTGSRNAYHEFAKAFVVPSRASGKIARWEHGICPVVVGQNPHVTTFIAQHLKFVAQAAGAPVNNDASCRPNIDIVFTTTPQALLDTVSKNDQEYLGYFQSVAEKTSLATVTRPIQAWYATETTDYKGRRRLDTGRTIVSGTTVGNAYGLPDNSSGSVFGSDQLSNTNIGALTDMAPFFAWTGNHLNDGAHTGFIHVLIVIDSTKLAGQEMLPLADYIAMLALAQINGPDACQDLPSIANRMTRGCGHSADSLTLYDLAFLQGVYRMTAGRTTVLQRSEIGDVMTDIVEKTR